DYNLYNNKNIENLYRTDNGYLKVIKSSMKFVSIILTIPKEISDDILLLGPFLEMQPTDKFIETLMKENNLDENLFLA
ncbi:hypothetical protein Q604_UNBC12425G0001, partial [human gut metagenome]